MKYLALLVLSLFSVTLVNGDANFQTTPSGIPIDRPWKKSIYAFAQKHSVHPSWGITHSERNYQMTAYLSRKEGIPVDADALFAAAFLHDIGGLAPFAKPGVDHAVRSVEVSEPLLHDWGFPPSKWPLVKDLILGHTYFGPLPETKLGLAFRDADILDFLGAMGIARIFAVTLDPERPSTTLSPGLKTLIQFRRTFNDKLSLPVSHQVARPRLVEMDRFFQSLHRESFNGTAL